MKVTLEVPDNTVAAYFCFLWTEDGYENYTMSVKPMNAEMMKAGKEINCWCERPQGAGDMWEGRT